MSVPQSSKLRMVAAIVALAIFAGATIWINYEVKVNVEQGRSRGSVDTMGNIKVGEMAPDFSLLDLSNRTVTLSSYRGQKVVLLDFWATWCGPCRMEMVDLQALKDKLKDRNFEILSLDQGEDASVAGAFVNRRKYGFRVLLDADGKVAGQYGVKAIPNLVLIDKNGVIQWLKVGYDGNNSELEKKLESLTTKFDLMSK
jgi:peroxiredoxin